MVGAETSRSCTRQQTKWASIEASSVVLATREMFARVCSRKMMGPSHASSTLSSYNKSPYSIMELPEQVPGPVDPERVQQMGQRAQAPTSPAHHPLGQSEPSNQCHQCTSWPFCPLDGLRFFHSTSDGTFFHFTSDGDSSQSISFRCASLYFFLFCLFLAIFSLDRTSHIATLLTFLPS